LLSTHTSSTGNKQVYQRCWRSGILNRPGSQRHLGAEENIATGYKSFFEDLGNEIRNLQANDVIGISPQQNDADVYNIGAEREHQVNSTNRAGNWDSSAELTGLILAPAVVTYNENWSQME
jgi:hypothetical protein